MEALKPTNSKSQLSFIQIQADTPRKVNQYLGLAQIGIPRTRVAQWAIETIK